MTQIRRATGVRSDLTSRDVAILPSQSASMAPASLDIAACKQIFETVALSCDAAQVQLELLSIEPRLRYRSLSDQPAALVNLEPNNRRGLVPSPCTSSQIRSGPYDRLPNHDSRQTICLVFVRYGDSMSTSIGKYDIDMAAIHQ